MGAPLRRGTFVFVLSIVSIVPVSMGLAAELTIAAANSTCVAIKAVGDLFSQAHGGRFKYICKSSGRLAKGMQGGAIRADYYISANKKWMDDMVRAGHVKRANVRSYWSNILVVAAPKGSALALPNWQALASHEVKQVLIGDPSTAPFGRYAKQALKSAGLWEKVKPKITTKKHITLLANTLTDAEEGTVGILFSTSVKGPLRPLKSVPDDWHDPIRYFSGPTVGSEKDARVMDFVRFLEGGEAQEAFRQNGFKVLP